MQHSGQKTSIGSLRKVWLRIGKIYAYVQSPFAYTVKPPNKGHFGDRPVVPCREVVLFSEVFF